MQIYTYIHIYVHFLYIYAHAHIYTHTYIYVRAHTFWTRFLQKISTSQQSVKIPAVAQPLTYSHLEMSLLSSELPEGIKHPLRHTDASNSKVRLCIREVSHLQGRQQLSGGTHYIQRTGVQDPQTVSPMRFCSTVYLQKKSLEKHKN